MNRLLLYPAIAFTAIPPAGAIPGNAGAWQPHNPVVFARPVNAAVQQYDAQIKKLQPTAVTAHGWEGQQYEYRFAKPFPAPQQQFEARAPIHVPFPVDIQGFTREWSVQFAKPFPAALQKYSEVYAFFLIPTVPTKQGWWPQPPDRFAKPFNAAQQQYTGVFKFPDKVPPQGWWGQQLEYRYAKPYPVTEQQFQPVNEPERFPTEQYGWWGYQLSYQFAKPFPVEQQIFAVWDLVGEVPVFKPPGAGKRYKYPTDYLPEPAYDVKPAKPFRPVWDKPKDGEIEQHPQAAKPVPLPPPEIFARMQPGAAAVPQNMPNFDHLVPHDPMGLKQRMQDAQDASDALAVLRAMGLLGDES